MSLDLTQRMLGLDHELARMIHVPLQASIQHTASMTLPVVLRLGQTSPEMESSWSCLMSLRGLFSVIILFAVATSASAAETVLHLATFRVDVTPPIGDGPCVGCMPKVSSIEHPLVECQLFAQQVAAKNSFTCVAGYGECGVWYYGPDHIFTDRVGYEQTWSLTGACQETVESALTRLLGRRQP